MRPYISTHAQREDMAYIKGLFYERGFRVFTPIRRFRRSRHDFLAIRHRECHLFQIGRKGIEVRSYYIVPLDNRATFVRRKFLQTGLRYLRPLPRFSEDDWKVLVVAHQHDEYDEMKQRVEPFYMAARGV